MFWVLFFQTSAGSSNSEAVPHFAELFVMVWGGAALVTLNTILVGSQLSFFQVRLHVHTSSYVIDDTRCRIRPPDFLHYLFIIQGLCVLGYCLLGQCISLIVCKVSARVEFVRQCVWIFRCRISYPACLSTQFMHLPAQKKFPGSPGHYRQQNGPVSCHGFCNHARLRLEHRCSVRNLLRALRRSPDAPSQVKDI